MLSRKVSLSHIGKIEQIQLGTFDDEKLTADYISKIAKASVTAALNEFSLTKLMNV